MTPGMSGSRKKPTCQTCGEPMAGHKRPHGSPVCPRDSASPSPPRSRTRATTTPTRASAEPASLLSRISPADVRFSPTPSGNWRRQNPNWVEPAHYARIPSHAPVQVPQRGDTIASWNSTELDEVSANLPSYGHPVSHGLPEDGEEEEEHEDVDESDSEYVGSQDTLSPAPSTSFARLSRHISKMFGRGTPLASVYGAPSEDVVAIEQAAQEHGLSTARVRRPRATIKAEPASPGTALDNDGSRSTLARESSWWVYVGRDRSAVDALAGTHARRAPVAQDEAEREPYDFDAGLDRERNERVGTYPVDPRAVRMNFCDVIIAGVVGAFGAVYFLSLM